MSGKNPLGALYCSDIHYGIAGPKICLTCKSKLAFVELMKREQSM